MHVPENQRITEIEKLEIDQKARDFLISLKVPDGLERLFESPFYFYTTRTDTDPASWKGLEIMRLLPLWEHSEQIFAVDLSVAPPEYISFYLELPQEPFLFGKSIYAAIFHMIYQYIWEYGGEVEEAKIAYKFAESVGMPRLKVLHEILDNFMEVPDEDIELYRRSLLIT